MLLLGSYQPSGDTIRGAAPTHRTSWTMTFPRIKDFYFTGTGDLFAALFLAWTYKMPQAPSEATERAIGTIQAVIRRTMQGCTVEGSGKHTAKHRELRLIESKAEIEHPDTSGLETVVTVHD